MEHVVKSTKLGLDWSTAELKAFNIRVVKQEAADFFGVDQLPALNVPPGILLPFNPKAVDDATYTFYGFLMRALNQATEYSVDNFAVALFRLMGYESCGCSVQFQVPLPLTVANVKRVVKTDICVVDRDGIYRVIQKAKRDDFFPLEELVANAIAAFDFNNDRLMSLHRKPLTNGIIPAIMLINTGPYFYKINVSEDLVNCVRNGIRPEFVTEVLHFVPDLPCGNTLGMYHLPNRLLSLQCYEAFKAIVFPPPK
jgi:hypothetical protein